MLSATGIARGQNRELLFGPRMIPSFPPSPVFAWLDLATRPSRTYTQTEAAPTPELRSARPSPQRRAKGPR